jgi:hypothetical protein
MLQKNRLAVSVVTLSKLKLNNLQRMVSKTFINMEWHVILIVASAVVAMVPIWLMVFLRDE